MVHHGGGAQTVCNIVFNKIQKWETERAGNSNAKIFFSRDFQKRKRGLFLRTKKLRDCWKKWGAFDASGVFFAFYFEICYPILDFCKNKNQNRILHFLTDNKPGGSLIKKIFFM